MARRPRAAIQAVSMSTRTPTSPMPELSDEEPINGPLPSDPATPQEEDGDEQAEEDQIGEEDEEEIGTPANDSEAPSIPARGQLSTSRKRRAGRPPKTRTHDWDAPDENGTRDAGSDIGTPRRRGGWRGRGFGGGRWGKPRGGPSHVTQVPLDKEGNMANVKDDEVDLPEDDEGEMKVDKMGNLLDGREYRVRVFTIAGKGDRLYMLSTEPARCIGFRDSYLFFQKHRQLYKIILAEDAKRDLIERNIIPHSYKGRAIGVVTARSVFREFGARIVIGGKKIIDDYQVNAARTNGEIEGDLAVPDDQLPGNGTLYDKNRYVAWHGASSVYHSGAPSVPLPSGKVMDSKKRKVIVTGVNWMFEHAREASRLNSALAFNRRQNLEGVYDPHTNVMQYPKIMQPTHARWEQLPPAWERPLTLRTPATNSHESSINGVTTVGECRNDRHQLKSIFPSIRPILTRNFMVSDTYYMASSLSGFGIPGPDEDIQDIGPEGLMHVQDLVLAELPGKCQRAFYETRAEEVNWKHSWGLEEDGRVRADLRISYNT